MGFCLDSRRDLRGASDKVRWAGIIERGIEEWDTGERLRVEGMGSQKFGDFEAIVCRLFNETEKEAFSERRRVTPL